MSKQEKIREGAKCIIRGHLPSNMGFDLDVVADNITRDVFRFQSSQGAVIKVDREASITIQDGNQTVIIPSKVLAKANYMATIPLIEE